MRHKVGFRKLGRVTPHRIALLRNMATALFERERIRTTLMKAKELRPYAEKLITQAKRDDDRLHARRLVAREIHDLTVVKKLFDDLGARYATRPGGYTRILRLGPRRGDGAEMAIVELLGSEYKPEKKDEKGKKIEAEKKPEAKAAKPAGGSPKAKKPKGESKAEDGEKKKPATARAKGKKKSAGKEA
ncbi:MAG TPA: 50S ribosomal protein L17 [Vicinamibacteria bacterium]|nr:50S ribosomal protein L17 [Vicinamibacteria bacterium]